MLNLINVVYTIDDEDREMLRDMLAASKLASVVECVVGSILHAANAPGSLRFVVTWEAPGCVITLFEAGTEATPHIDREVHVGFGPAGAVLSLIDRHASTTDELRAAALADVAAEGLP